MSVAFANQEEFKFKDGCLSVRKAVLDKMRAQNAPGPIYNPVPRVLSKERKLRHITFGTGPARYNDEPENKKPMLPGGEACPGPQTYDQVKIRKAIFMQSNKRNIRGIKFTTGERESDREVRIRSAMPSPQEYDPDMIRRGIMFSKSGMTNVKFGKAREQSPNLIDTPGPQSYDPDGIRRGILFTKSTLTTTRISAPPKSKKRDVEVLPGPQDYDTERIRKGIFSLSKNTRPAGVKFSTGPRTYNDAEERERASKPGPLAYNVPSGLGKQLDSRYKSQPMVTFGAR